MMFTWLVVFVVIGLTGSWWWQNHKAQQEDIATMANESSAQLAKNGQLQSSDPSNGSDDVAAATDTQSLPVPRQIPRQLTVKRQTFLRVRRQRHLWPMQKLSRARTTQLYRQVRLRLIRQPMRTRQRYLLRVQQWMLLQSCPIIW